jgi:hypothetical protein
MNCHGSEYIPPCVKQITLKGLCTLTEFPDTVEDIYMEDDYNKPMQLPKKLWGFSMSDDYNLPVAIPNSVRSVLINSNYDCSILPESVEELWCTTYAGYPATVTRLDAITITKFPLNAIQLSFNELICDIATMPKTVTAVRYSGDVVINLPFPVHTYKYYGPLTEDVVFLDGIKKLSINADRDATINIPESVQDLKIRANGYKLQYNLPQNLINLVTDMNHQHIPDTIKYLDIECMNSVDNFPKNLKTLIIRRQEYGEVELSNVEQLKINVQCKLNVPESVKHLKIGDSFNGELFVPANVITLKLGHNFNSRITFAPNSKLYSIKFGNAYNLYTEFPDSVRRITFGNYFNQHFISKAEYIRFGDYFNQYINMPDLKWLRVGSHFGRDIIAPNLKTLKTCGWTGGVYVYLDVEEFI